MTKKTSGQPLPPIAAESNHRFVLIVEDDENIRDTLADLFDVPSNNVSVAATLEDALAALRRQDFDLVVSDIRLGGKRDGGLQVMAASGLLSPDATLIVLTAFPDDDNRFASLRLGATHFLEKPVDLRTIASLAADGGVKTAMDDPAQDVAAK
jgi:DNA-binding NtrC family response regulator